MAFDFSKLNFFGKLDARSRVFVLFGAVIGVIGLVYLLANYISPAASTTGATTVANAPPISSMPGEKTTAEYYNALKATEKQAAQQAQISGTSAVPTIMNTGMRGQGSCVICSDEGIDVKATLNDMVSRAKISPDVASQLSALVDKDVPVSDFAAHLDRLIRDKKLDPEDARTLLEQYRKQHTNRAVQESAKLIDSYVQTGQIPLDAANKLLDAQKRGVSVGDYSDMLQDMVSKGQITPELAKDLLAHYMAQQDKEAASRNVSAINRMVASGAITQATADEINKMIGDNVPVDQLAAKLAQLVKDGKITPEAARKILDDYRAQKGHPSEISSINKYIKKAEDDAYQELVDLQKDGKITPDTAASLRRSIAANISFKDYADLVSTMVRTKQLTPEIAGLKLGDYKKVKDLRDLAEKLQTLQANNASVKEYEDALKAAVNNGVITPDQASQLEADYQTMRTQATLSPTGATPGLTPAMAELQQNATSGKLAEAAAPYPSATSGAPQNFSEAQLQAQREAEKAKQDKMAAIVAAMNGQANNLINSAWTTPTMEHKDRSGGLDTGTSSKSGEETKSTSSSSTSSSSSSTSTGGAPLIKSGTILFAVLDTAVNSDYPTSPVLATIVDGPFKGAKLLGRLQVTKSPSGQLDRIMLNFDTMNMDAWTNSKKTSAFAIDPDTARSVLATDVDYHYMQRFGALMATSFLQGYGQAVMSSGGTQVASAFGTSSSTAALSPSSKVAVALGQMGQALGTATQNYTTRPPTVVVDSGVGLGILFMSDVT